MHNQSRLMDAVIAVLSITIVAVILSHILAAYMLQLIIASSIVITIAILARMYASRRW